MEHSKHNVINLEDDENFGVGNDSDEEVEDYIKEEQNKRLIKKKFSFNLGRRDLGIDLPKGYLGSKEKGDKDINHCIAVGDDEYLEDTIRSKIADKMFDFMT